ncbi:MAG TPA: class I SAM-dependent methyltransferase [Burkholderiales bacterium]|nr:class I SAM-dependent methyltransferase [Burkholderiales bacterium]
MVIPIGDVVLAPFVFFAACLLKLVRRVGVYRMTIAHAILRRVGVFPIRDHYYEPMFNPRHLRYPLEADRSLPGIDMNAGEQLALLSKFNYQSELAQLARDSRFGFRFDNPNFGPGDAEFLYSAIRHHKPGKILEIGSGHSTLVMLEAIEANRSEHADYVCELVCVEPYEMQWLEKTPGIAVLRQRIEDLDERHVRALRANDILFIDSSHVIRPQGDVLREYLELLPLLAPGVLVHLHDIFTPRDYPARWVVGEVRIWNEQYLFEAFMCGNDGFRIIGALNFLARHHHPELAAVFPVLRAAPECEPGSMWLLKA